MSPVGSTDRRPEGPGQKVGRLARRIHGWSWQAVSTSLYLSRGLLSMISSSSPLVWVQVRCMSPWRD